MTATWSIKAESDLLWLCRKRARTLELLTYHVHDSRNSEPGFPDLVIAGPYGLLYRELKMPGRGLRPEQVTWKYILLASGQDWGLWYPEDLESGKVTAQMEDISRFRQCQAA